MKLLLPFIFCSSLATKAFEIVAPESSERAWSKQAALERAMGFNKDLKTLRDTRIIGGGNAASGRYPYYTYVELSTSDKVTFFCSATLIWEDAILTASHCVVDILTSGRTITAVSAYVGLDDLSNRDPAKMSEVEKAAVHPGYNALTNENDIAVFKLLNPVLSVSPVQLNFNAAIPADGVGVDVFGFGATSTDTNIPLPTVLQKVSLSAISTADCNDANSYNGDINATSMMCAGVALGGKVSSTLTRNTSIEYHRSDSHSCYLCAFSYIGCLQRRFWFSSHNPWSNRGGRHSSWYFVVRDIVRECRLSRSVHPCFNLSNVYLRPALCS